MATARSGFFFNLLLLLLISLTAWPVFVAVSVALSLWVGESPVLTLFAMEPKSKLLAEFIIGFKASAAITGALGVLAVVDYQLFSRHRLTWLFAGLSLPVACIGMAIYFYHEPVPLLPAFATTGIVLFVIYRLADRLRRMY